MSRIIIKGLPPTCTENKLRDEFKSFGNVTDCSLKYTKDGKFRRFAFVGFDGEDAGRKAIEQRNATFMGSAKLQVEECKPFGDERKPRAWSKYAKDSSAYKRTHGETVVAPEAKASTTVRRGADTDDEEEAEGTPAKKGRKQGSKLDEDFKNFLEAKGVNIQEEQTAPVPTPATEEIDHSELLSALLSGIRGDTSLSLTVTGLPSSIKQKHLKDWFAPVKVKALKVERGTAFAAAFISFERAPDIRRALQKNGQFLGGFKASVQKVEGEKAAGDAAEGDSEMASVPGVSREEEEAKIRDAILDTGRLFLRNLPFSTTEDDLRYLFKKFGEIADVQVIVSKKSGSCKGFAIVEFIFPESAVAAYAELDGSIFKGRMLHIVAGEEKRAKEDEEGDAADGGEKSSFKKEKMTKLKKNAAKSTHSWNALFLGANAVADTLAEKLGVEKRDLLQESGESTAVRLALAETRLVRETRDFLLSNGVQLDAFSRPAAKRSDTVIIVKNLPAGVPEEELSTLFKRYGDMQKCLLPPEGGVSALVVMGNSVDAKKAFQHLAYARFRTQPLMLEWAPFDVFGGENEEAKKEEEGESKGSGETKEKQTKGGEEEAKTKKRLELTEDEKKSERRSRKHKMKDEEEAAKAEEERKKKEAEKEEEEEKEKKKEQAKKNKKSVKTTEKEEKKDMQVNGEEGDEEEREAEEGSLVFVKNLSFDTADKSLRRLFASNYDIQSAKVSRKLNPADPARPLSMGFGFVQFYTREDALDAIKNMQGALLDGHCVELKLSNREADEDGQEKKKKRKTVDRLTQGNCTKIMVRNLPFQATSRELESLFTTFGNVKSARIPKKVGGMNHRGFGFVDFATKGDAKRAFDSLVHSTHLYGRRLVLEWAKNEEDSVQELREKTAANYSGDAREQRKMKKRMDAIANDLKVIDDD